VTELNESEIRKMPFFVTWHTMFLSIYDIFIYILNVYKLNNNNAFSCLFVKSGEKKNVQSICISYSMEILMRSLIQKMPQIIYYVC
jgi:hypothetical protein